MPEYVLRMEGVNLDAFVYDTQDLSTIRGGSLLLLKAARSVATWPTFTSISRGASAALVSFMADNDTAAVKVRDEVRTSLHAGPLAHGTFVVNVVRREGSYQQNGEALMALNRWSQLQQPTIAVPAQWQSDAGPCGMDKLRPASVPGPGDKPISPSVFSRRENGDRGALQQFYEDFADVKKTLRFVNDFEKLAEDPSKGYLNGKMAVIYIDGNAFGTLRRKHCTDEPSERAFDTEIQRLRRTLLTDLIARVSTEDGWATRDGDIRLQTLLWGGDDILWVVPAWKGWSTLQFFFERAGPWTVSIVGGVSGPLKHGASLVFCNHKAPIYRIKTLVHALADDAKEDKEKNLFAYQILESYDYIGADLDKFREMRLPPGAPKTAWLLDGTSMNEVASAVRVVKEEVPKKRVIEAVRTGLQQADTADTRIQDIERSMERAGLSEQARSALDTLNTKAGGELARWTHLAELWDYIV